ncbi:hypothetical protein D3C76_1798140 [compost metagenome]
MMVMDLGVSSRGAVNFGDETSSTLNVSIRAPVTSVASSSSAVPCLLIVLPEVSARLIDDHDVTASPSAV